MSEPKSSFQTCDRCGARWPLKWKCQVICTNCGARLDCSDLFLDHERIQQLRRDKKDPDA